MRIVLPNNLEKVEEVAIPTGTNAFLAKLASIEGIIQEELGDQIPIQRVKEGIQELRVILNNTPEIVMELADEDIGRMATQARRCVDDAIMTKVEKKATKKKKVSAKPLGARVNLNLTEKDILF